MKRIDSRQSAMLAVLGFGILFVATGQDRAEAQCWTKGTEFCSVWGTGTACTNVVCKAGLISWYCPTGQTEWQRLVPANTNVPACGNPVKSGFNCTTVGGATTWCIESVPCSSDCTARQNQSTGAVTFYCDPPTRGPNGTGSRAGITAASFTTPCPKRVYP